jgi:Arabinose efflux permease
VSRLVGGDDPGTAAVVASLTAGVFFGGVGGGVAFPTLPTLGPLLGMSPAVVGVVLAVNRFTRLLLNAPVGQVFDTVGTRRPMIAGFLAQGLAPFGYVLGLDPGGVPLGSAGVFVLSRVLWGVGSAFVFVGTFSVVTHVTTADDRGRWVGYVRGGQSLGFPAGLVVGGVVADTLGYAAAFLVAGCAGLFAAGVAALVLPDVSPDVGSTARLRDLPGMVRADGRILAVGAVNLVVRFVFAGVLLSTVVLYAREHGVRVGGLSEVGASGAVMAVGVVAASAATVAVGRYSDSLPNRAAVALPTLCVLAGGFVVLAAVPTLPGVLAGVAVVGLGVGGTNPPLFAYLGDIAPADDLGKLGGVYNVFGDLGSALGPVVALPLVVTVGFRGEYLACAGLAVLVGLLAVRTLSGDPTPVAERAVES